MDGWCPNEDNVVSGTISADAEEDIVLDLPIGNGSLAFPEGCIPLEDCCGVVWPDPLDVEFGRFCFNPDDEMVDPLMFGSISVQITDEDGEDFMVNGMVVGFREQITLSVNYDPEFLSNQYIAEENLTLKYRDAWSESWVEPREVEVDYDAIKLPPHLTMSMRNTPCLAVIS